MVKVLMDNNKTMGDKAPLIYICSVCGKKKNKQQISDSKHVPQCKLQDDDAVRNDEVHKLTDEANGNSISKLANGRFLNQYAITSDVEN